MLLSGDVLRFRRSLAVSKMPLILLGEVWYIIFITMELPKGNYGDDITTSSLFQFPTLANLANATEEQLRGMGLGYLSSKMYD